MRFYFDRTQSPHLARAVGEILGLLGHQFDHSRNRYPGRDPGDRVWLGDLAADGGWIIITGDERIRRNPGEKEAWRQAGLTTFFLQDAWQNTPGEEQAWRMLRWLPRIIEVAGSHHEGTGISLPLKWHAGRLPVLYTPKGQPRVPGLDDAGRE